MVDYWTIIASVTVPTHLLLVSWPDGINFWFKYV